MLTKFVVHVHTEQNQRTGLMARAVWKVWLEADEQNVPVDDGVAYSYVDLAEQLGQALVPR